jgi:hypothetical protein
MWHVLQNDEFMDNAKMIGVYRSHSDCEAAIARLKDQPGFRDYVAGFHVDEYLLNKDHWTAGFVDGNAAAEWFDKNTNSD